VKPARHALALLVAILLASCGSPPPEESMTAGHVRIGAAESAYKISWHMSATFQAGYPAAFVDILPGQSGSLLDSLLQGKIEQALLDRRLDALDSAAFQKAGRKLFTYNLAAQPVYLLVPPQQSLTSLDSLALRRVLEGKVGSWAELGGSMDPVHLYIPSLAGGAMHSLLAYYKGLPQVSASAYGSRDSLITAARGDAGALVLWPWPVEGLPWKALAFGPVASPVYPDAATMMEGGGYPFRLDLTYATTRSKQDLAAGFLTFLMSNTGQREYMNQGYRPAAVPVRIVRLTKGTN
jgi:ABC-type phosphate transport system substrate-binding protein